MTFYEALYKSYRYSRNRTRNFSCYVYRFNAIYVFSVRWSFSDEKKWVLPLKNFNFFTVGLTVLDQLFLFITISRAYLLTNYISHFYSVGWMQRLLGIHLSAKSFLWPPHYCYVCYFYWGNSIEIYTHIYIVLIRNTHSILKI